MTREVVSYKKPDSVYPNIVIMDMRDVMYGDYSVERLDKTGCGYEMVYSHPNLQRCIERAEKLFAGM